MSPRACGECRACCFVMGVKELTKPPYANCAHECDKGCAIYEKRPESCAGYQCLWLVETNLTVRADAGSRQLLLRDEERPDKSGLLFEVSSINRAESAFEKETGVPYLMVREATLGAFESYWGQKVLKRLSKWVLIIRVYGDGRRTAMGPPDKVRLVGEFLQKVRVRTE